MISQLSVKGAPGKTKSLQCFCLAASESCQCAFDYLFFIRIHFFFENTEALNILGYPGGRRICEHRALLCYVLRQIRYADDTVMTQYKCTFNCVLKFAYVTRPFVAEKYLIYGV